MPDPKTRLRPMLAPDDELVFDTVQSIRHGNPAGITQLPVETGSLMTDHIQVQGAPLFIRGVVSATPTADADGPGGDPRELAVAWFRRNRTELLEAITPMGVYRDLLMADWPHEYTGAQRYIFDVQLVHVRLVSPVSVPIPPRLPAAEVAAGTSSEQDAGDTADEEVPENKRPTGSFLGAVAGAIFGGRGGD